MIAKEQYVKPEIEVIELEVSDGIMIASPGGHEENLTDTSVDETENGIVAYSRKRNFWK